MKSLIVLLVTGTLLSGCSCILDMDPSGLTPPPAGDRVPAPHG